VTIRKRIAAADRILLSWGAAAGRPGLDRAMQGLGHTADNGAVWIAVATGLGVRRNNVLRTSQPTELLVDGRRSRVWLLFVGNCRYEPRGSAPAYRPDLADGTFDVRMVDGSQPLARTRLVAAVLLGTLGRCRVYRTWSASSLRVASLHSDPVPICLDGEATETKPAISLIKRPRKLLVYRPDNQQS
jgi:diacylglycerol kinase family enzyme